VIERFPAFARGFDEDLELAANLLLPDVLFEGLRPQRALDRLFLRRRRGRGDDAVGFDHGARKLYRIGPEGGGTAGALTLWTAP
jgi:hypothetical protein